MATTLLAGFEPRMVAVDGDDLFVAVGGSGPALVVLHGYPQTHAMWHAVAPELAKRFTVYAFDLPGYGASAVPEEGPERYTKRRMAQDIVTAMASLGVSRFHLAGHDRGGRVAYRMAFDHPEQVATLSVLDIVPTGAMWAGMRASLSLKYYHWMFLAQPGGLPERLIGADPSWYLRHTIGGWTKAGDLSAFTPEAMAAYEAAFIQPARLKAMCDDYRAGATIDDADDQQTRARGETIAQPTLVLWGGGAPMAGAKTPSPLDVWQDWATHVTGQRIDCGHFLCEEAPEDTLAALMQFLEKHRDTVVVD